MFVDAVMEECHVFSVGQTAILRPPAGTIPRVTVLKQALENHPCDLAVRHQAVAGKLASLSQHVSPAALREAALAAADPPPDIRRGNRRLHYEKVLLGLYDAARR